MDMAGQIQFLDVAVSVLLCTNALRNGMYSSLLSPATDKIVG